MPKIINAYSGNESVANSLKSLGDSMFGNQSQQALIRENAKAKGAENENAEPFARAARDGDRNAMAYYGALARKQGADVGNFNLLSTANHAKGVDDPGLATAQLGAHEPISSTAVGQGRSLANATGIARIQSDTAAATQRAIAERQNEQARWTDEHTLVDVRGPDGRVVKVPKSQATQPQYDVQPSLDQVKANMISPAASATPGQGAAAPAFPTNPDVRSMVGLPTALQSYVHPQTQEVVTSQDNGQTFVDKAGRRGSLAGSGFMPIEHGAALGEARTAQQRQEAAGPGPTFPDPTKSAAAADAYTNAGVESKLQEHVNAAAGAIPGVRNILETFGNGEIGAGTERARSAQEVRNNEARTALLSSPGRQAIQQQKWVNELLPETGFAGFSNPTTEAQKVPVIVNALKADYTNERRLAADINTPPAERQAAIARMHKVENAIRLFTAPPEQQGAAPAGPQAAQPAQAAPAQGAAPAGPVPSATDRNGNKIYFRNGQWGP